MDAWLSAVFAAIGGSVGFWFVWGRSISEKGTESVLHRLGASAFLLFFLTVIVLLGKIV